MSLTGILVHTAVRVRTEVAGPVIEGEREEVVIEGTPFACVLFPAGTREGGRDGRRIEQPQILVSGLDQLGDDIDLASEDRVRVTSAPGLTETDLGEYQVDGEPLALGKPGLTPRGYQVQLRRVVE